MLNSFILKQVTNDNSILLIHTVQFHLSPLEIESRKGPQAEDNPGAQRGPTSSLSATSWPAFTHTSHKSHQLISNR